MVGPIAFATAFQSARWNPGCLSTETTAANLTEKGEKLKDEMDALIDEIDEVLEENAEEFVKNYVQRGGE